MHDRIASAIACTKVPENGVDVCVAQRLDDVLDKSGKWFVIQLETSDLFKEIS